MILTRFTMPAAMTMLMIGVMPMGGWSQDAVADDQAAHTADSAMATDKDDLDAETEARYEKFQKALSGTKFVGRFTISALANEAPREEEYTIVSVKKLDKGDFWEIKARIKYGDHDVTVPMAIEVKWADKTPVLTVDRLFVPGLGTFDARVLLRKDKYAGTWAHGDVGGHLFGRIVKLEAESKPEPSSNDKH